MAMPRLRRRVRVPKARKASAMSYLPIKPCPKCHSRKRGMWLGNADYNRPWKIVCKTCGMEQWFESDERAYSEWIEHDEYGMVHFDDDGLEIAFDLVEIDDSDERNSDERLQSSDAGI